MVYNFSKDSEYHTQINNKVIPEASCNTTSIIMALKQAGHKPIFAMDGEQPEDRFTRFLIESEQSLERMKNRFPWFVEQKIRACEVHEMLAWGINYLMTFDIDRFSKVIDIKTMANKLLEGCGIVLSGLFPVKKKKIGHIVALAGFTTIDDKTRPSLDNISEFIIDDPRGNFKTDYKDPRGNNIRITKDEFTDIFKNTENPTQKWAHIIRPPNEFELQIYSNAKY